MKKSEIKALKEAFNIPEPEKKNDFIKLYEERFENNKRRFYPIMIFRYVSAAVMAAVVVGLCGIAGKNADFNDKFNNSLIIESKSENNSDDSSEKYSDVTGTDSIVQSTAASSGTVESTSHPVTTQSDATVSVVNNGGNVDEPTEIIVTENNEVTSEIATDSDVIETTSAVVTTEKVTSTSAAEPTTSEEPSKESDEPLVDCNDHTIIPPVIYDPDDSVYYIDNNDIGNDNIDSDALVKPPLNQDDTGVDSVSEYVFIASLDKIIYTEIDGEPYTQENITIISELKGDGKFTYNDKISVFIEGGYMPAEKFAESHAWLNIPSEYSYVYYSEKQFPKQQAGEKYLFFLDKDNLFPEKEVFITNYIAKP